MCNIYSVSTCISSDWLISRRCSISTMGQNVVSLVWFAVSTFFVIASFLGIFCDVRWNRNQVCTQLYTLPCIIYNKLCILKLDFFTGEVSSSSISLSGLNGRRNNLLYFETILTYINCCYACKQGNSTLLHRFYKPTIIFVLVLSFYKGQNLK